jgi:hypothetical protein
MSQIFPKTTVGGIALPRIIIGTNWLLGWSHTGPAADKMIRDKFGSAENFMPVFDAYLSYGCNAIMGPVSQTPLILEAIRLAENKFGQKIIIIDTPWINVDDNADARKSAHDVFRHAAEVGCTFSLIHHSSMEQLVNKNKRIIDRLPDYLSMIRESGQVPGLSAHMPEIIPYCDDNGYDVETYIQIFNCMGFLMQVEIEAVAGIIRNAKKPVMTIKPFAAGRVTPFVGLTFNWNAIRDCDMITMGVISGEEARENIELSLSILERRAPDVYRRSSPVADQAAFGNK